MSDDEIEAFHMRTALSAIANEMRMLHTESIASSRSDKCENEEILNKLIKCKTSLSLRKIQIRKLRHNLKTACAVAKTMSSAKATETAALNNHLEFARNQYLDLMQQQSEKKEIINNLRSENLALHEQLDFFNNVIQLGYKELQEIRNERVEDMSTLEQLKRGQYYADHCNEHEKCTRLEQKNRFLKNKLLITESNLEAASEELRSLRISRNPTKEKRDNVTRSRHCIDVVRSEYRIGQNQSNIRNVTMTKIELNNNNLDLTGHLTTVKQLLNDQDHLIKDLKSLSKVINNDEL